jgi:hypothetical protein
LGVQNSVNKYLFPHTHKDDGCKIFSPIEGMCIITTSLDMFNEENMEEALSMESKEHEFFVLL